MTMAFVISGWVVLLISAIIGFKNRHNTSKCILSVTLGISLATFLLVLPTRWIGEGESVENPAIYTMLSSFYYSLEVLSGKPKLEQLASIPLEGVLRTAYMYINYVTFAVSPILASGLILSLFGDLGERMRFGLRFSPKCYVFSELNDNSLALASGIKRKPGRKTMVFCNTKDADKNLVVSARKLGAVTLYKPCDCMKISRRFPIYEFCLISADEDQNMHLAETLICKYADTKKAKVHINAFAESGTNVKFLESVIRSKGDDTKVELRCIDEIALFCNHLVYNHPLYHTKDNGNHISVAIIGAGRTGMRMLKTAYWAGQIDGYSLKIRMYDKNADTLKNAFYSQCPGLVGDKTIEFVKADVDTHDFEEKLLAPENSADATYIVVAMGNDQLNLSVSDTLYRIYRRHLAFNDAKMPEIFTRVRSQAKTDAYFVNTEFMEKRNIHLFGTTATVFSDKAIFNTELENLAFAVHLAYGNCLGLDPNSKKYKEACKAFRTGEYNRRSSMAVALHIPAKLCMCKDIPKTGENNLTSENVQTFARCLAEDEAFVKQLARNEHIRWNAYMLTEGYQQATEDEMHQYAAAVGRHKDDLSMLHPCITSWENLDVLEKAYNRTYQKDEHFQRSDEDIVKSIPTIWEASQKMNGEN